MDDGVAGNEIDVILGAVIDGTIVLEALSKPPKLSVTETAHDDIPNIERTVVCGELPPSGRTIP